MSHYLLGLITGCTGVFVCVFLPPPYADDCFISNPSTCMLNCNGS